MGIGQNDLRFGDVLFGTFFSISCESFLCSSCRSVDPKFRAVGLRDGVPAIGDCKMIIFLHGSQIPDASVMGF